MEGNSVARDEECVLAPPDNTLVVNGSVAI